MKGRPNMHHHFTCIPRLAWVVAAAVAAAAAAAIAGGCETAGVYRSSAPSTSSSSSRTSHGSAVHARNNIDPREVQQATMGFADRYLAAVADVYDQAQRDAPTPQARIMAQRLKILAGMGALGSAVDPNPLGGLIDMALMVSLTRRIAEDPWTREVFGPDTADAMLATLKIQEADVWGMAAAYLTPAQIDELQQLAERWRREHPDQRYPAAGRLADFPESRAGAGGAGVMRLADSIFGIVSLDPFRGLDPAVREVTQARILAERVFFHLRHMPLLVSWQTNSLYEQMLAQPQVTQLFADTATVAKSTAQFTDATSRFSDASNELAQTVEKFRLQLPEQQAKLLAELNDLVARQREGALQQATTQVTVERDATIKQLGATVAAQQDLLTRNLQAVTDQSIDRLYARTRSLALITVGAILLAFVLYRLLAQLAWKGSRQ